MTDQKDHKVIDFFSGKSLDDIAQERIIRLSPETDGLCMLYANDKHPERFFAMKILCWGLRWNGDVVGMVPWLNRLTPCPEINDPLNGSWHGYFDPEVDSIFYDAPLHKVVELETSVSYFETHLQKHEDISSLQLQEIPDNIGTHALLINDSEKSLILSEVISWRLYGDGHLSATLVDLDNIEETPVLPGDKSLYPADDNPQFRYFFQRHIAHQIKQEDPDALEAIAMLMEEDNDDTVS